MARVEYDYATLDFLIATHCLAEADAADSRADAIAAMLADAARGTMTLDAVTSRCGLLGFR